MFKVAINYSGNLDDYFFETEMPKIPIVGEYVGFWHEGEWIVADITSIIFEFNEDNEYTCVELNVTDCS